MADPLCPYCGKALSPAHPYYNLTGTSLCCAVCGLLVNGVTAASRPFREEWGTRPKGSGFVARRYDRANAELLKGSDAVVRRLAWADWEEVPRG